MKHLVGERGPELFTPTGSPIIPAHVVVRALNRNLPLCARCQTRHRPCR